MHPANEELMLGYQQADPDSRRLLIERLSPAFARFFSELQGTRHEADDLLQEFWLRVHKGRHHYRAGSPLLPWLYAIARNTRADGHRRMLRHHTLPILEYDVYSDRRSRPQAFDSAIDFQTLAARLPEGQRRALVLLKIGGLSLKEVAETTGSTVGSVKQKAHQAYKRMRRDASWR